jgi:hypothetical protein
MKFLVVVQDLRMSGTSEGIVSRSFLSKLRIAYPESDIDVVYLKQYVSEDRLDLLPVNSIQSHVLNLKIPFFNFWLNKIYWRLFHVSLKERYIHKVYASYLKGLDSEQYDHVFIRSSGLNFETILGAKGLPILKRSIINFHDPYPLYWYPSSKVKLSKLELFRMKEMSEVVSQAKKCISSAGYMSQDLEYLYGSKKFFYTLPHQFCPEVFDFSDTTQVLKKTKKVVISYHGAIQFGRNIENLLDAYCGLLESNELYRENTDFILRLKSSEKECLAEKYSKTSNIIILDCLNFSNSSYEQIHETDITIILENGPLYCNILVGKSPFLAYYNKPVLSISPIRSELRKIIKDERYIANCNDKEEIKQKLESLILNRMNSEEPVYPFGDYFSNENFKRSLEEIMLS